MKNLSITITAILYIFVVATFTFIFTIRSVEINGMHTIGLFGIFLALGLSTLKYDWGLAPYLLKESILNSQEDKNV